MVTLAVEKRIESAFLLSGQSSRTTHTALYKEYKTRTGVRLHFIAMLAHETWIKMHMDNRDLFWKGRKLDVCSAS
jgi:hypothetical protein